MANDENEIPEIPEEWMTEAKRHFPAYLTFTRDRCGTTEYTCTRCNGTGTVKPLERTQTPADRAILQMRHNETVTCPLCGTQAQALNRRMVSMGRTVQFSLPFAFFFRLTPERLLIRVFWLQHLWDGDERQFFYYTYEPVRYYLAPGVGRLAVFSHFAGGYGIRERVDDVPYGTVMIGDTDLADTFLKYNSYDLYRAETHDPCYIRYLCYYARYPLIEQLVKAGYADFVYDLVSQDNPNKSVIDFTVPSVKAAFKVRIEDLRRRKSVYVYDTCQLMRLTAKFKRFGAKAFDKALFYKKNIMTAGVKSEADLIHRLTGATYEQMHAYLCRQRGEHRLTEMYRFYKDYLEQAQKLDAFTTDSSFLFPRDFMAAHDRIADLYNAKLEAERQEKEKELMKKSAALTKRLRKQYGYEDEHYTIVLPRTMGDIVHEGKELRHCVGGYARRHFEGTTVIVFVRRKEAVKTSYFTVEFTPTTRLIRQIHGLSNCNPDKELQAFVDAWQKDVLRRLDNEQKHKKRKQTNKGTRITA